MFKEGKKCVIYIRVSTEMQVDGYSLDGQKTILTDYYEREKMIIKGIYEDAGKSGRSIEGRPAFRQMLSDIEDGLEIDYVLVYKLSRFGRNALDILNSLDFIQSYGVNLISVTDCIDSSQTSGKLLISVLSAVSEIERENIIEQTMNGRREKARQGLWNGGFAPYGYSLVNKKLVINEEEALAIKMIFDIYANTEKGSGGVAKELNDKGIKKNKRKTGKLEIWTANTVCEILDNPVYVGMIAFGRRIKEKVKGTKDTYHIVNAKDYILVEGQHEPLISKEQWEIVNEKRKKNTHRYDLTEESKYYVLSGILYCPLCDRPMNINKTRNTSGQNHHYYCCYYSRHERGIKCNYRKMIRKEYVETYITSFITSLKNYQIIINEIKKNFYTRQNRRL